MKWPTHLYLFYKIKANLRVNERRQKLLCWSVAHLIFFLHVCKNHSEFLIVQYFSCLISETFFPPGPAKGQIYNMLNCLVFFPFLSSGPSWQLPPHQCLQMAGTSTRGRTWAQQLTAWVSWAHSPWQWVAQGADWALLPSPSPSNGGPPVEHPRAGEGQWGFCLFLQAYSRETKKVNAYEALWTSGKVKAFSLSLLKPEIITLYNRAHVKTAWANVY